MIGADIRMERNQGTINEAIPTDKNGSLQGRHVARLPQFAWGHSITTCNLGREDLISLIRFYLSQSLLLALHTKE
jgi:hypothetical protein